MEDKTLYILIVLIFVLTLGVIVLDRILFMMMIDMF